MCLPQVPSQCVESQSFTTPPVYSPGKQGTKTKICSITTNLTELGDFEKVIIPKRPRSSKKSSDGATGMWGKRSKIIFLNDLLVPQCFWQKNIYRWYFVLFHKLLTFDSFTFHTKQQNRREGKFSETTFRLETLHISIQRSNITTASTTASTTKDNLFIHTYVKSIQNKQVLISYKTYWPSY